MSKEENILELQKRWDRIRIANLYDTLDEMGYPYQCLDLTIKPLFEGQHLAGKAVTFRGSRDMRTKEEFEEDMKKKNSDEKESSALTEIKDIIFPGAVAVVDGGGEPVTGKFGEMTSWNLKQKGAKGIVLDGSIRDKLGLKVIPDYTVCARGTSPVESSKRWRVQEKNVPIALPGTLTSQVEVRPGDWIVGGPDGVIVVPQDIAMEVLEKAEEIEEKEENMRQDLASGMTFEECYEKYGRA